MPNERGKLSLIGVGGTGMLPLALLLKDAGYHVQGMDTHLSDKNRKLLLEKGIDIVNHELSVSLLDNVQQVVISPAIPAHHPVLRAARRKRIDVIPRSKALAQLIRHRSSICIAGSHGKSTTTAMLKHIMNEAGLPIGYMLGATTAEISPSCLGIESSPFILEACEAHGSLHDWQPSHAIITNIDDEHTSHYGGVDALNAAFQKFMQRVPPNGTIILCGDDRYTQKLAEMHPSCVTFGFNPGNRLQATEQFENNTVLLKDGHPVGTLSLIIPGQHNLLNAMAAYAMATALGVTSTTALSALSSFTGVNRRLQLISPSEGPLIFDDFAHHPAEIEATLTTARALSPNRLVAILQPQLHSRVRELAPAFARALSIADRCLLLPVEGLGEAAGIHDTNSLLAQACVDAKLKIEHAPNLAGMLVALKSNLLHDDCIVVMAGRSGDAIAHQVLHACRETPVNNKSIPSIIYGRKTEPAPNLIETITKQALLTPDAFAVQIGSRSLSYGELMARSADLAMVLRSKGVLPQQTVGVCLGRSMDRVVAFFAILRLGAIYLPLDPAQPKIRLESMLQDSATRVVIVNNASPALPDLDLVFVNCHALKSRPHTSKDFDIINTFSHEHYIEALAYLIFTSGTTGHPKGVEVGHASLANYATAAIEYFAIRPASRVSLVSGFGFDVSIGDMAMSLAAGACLVIPTDLQAIPGAPLGRFIAHTKLTHLSITPSLLSVTPTSKFPDLTTIIVAGESCHPALVERWALGRTFINAYGPTEATVEATFFTCSPGRPTAIGQPIDNMGACVMDDDLSPVPLGQEGELCLFGEGLARGYLNQSELTQARFINITLPDHTQQRIYRSGDQAMIDHSGQLHCLGRQDDQFKYHGHRIEPGEIESVLCSFNQIQDAVVSKVETPTGERLIAHIVLSTQIHALDHAALKLYLSAQLPTYMQPSVVLPLSDIPRSANGKRDRSALPLPPLLFNSRQVRHPKTPTEESILALTKEIAEGNRINGTRESLHHAGFDSLELASLLVSIEGKFGVTLDLSLEEGNDTIEALGLAVDSQLSTLLSVPSKDQYSRLPALLKPHLASWPGSIMGPSGLLRCLQPESPARIELFWCFQGGEEFASLTHALNTASHDNDIKLFGLRSGHLAFDYEPETLTMLAKLYANEIESVASSEIMILGGNCQGGMITAEVTKELNRRGKKVPLTILMEQGQFKPMSGNVLLLFGTRSYLNPYGQLEAPEYLFRQAYPDGFRVQMLAGEHGEYFRPQHVHHLSAAIRTALTHYF